MMEIGDALVLIADKLGITVQQVYELFVSVQAAKGILLLIEIVAFLIGAYFYISWLWGRTHRNDYNGDPEFNVICGGIFGLTIYMILLLLIGNAIMHILYPEYYGAAELIESLLKFR